MALDPSSRARLTRRTAPHFPGEGLFATLARTVCEAECLPRKELYEAWEVARRARRRLRGGRVLDVAAGHGLLAWTLLLLDDSSPDAVCIDRRRPPSAARLEQVLVARWPRLAGRVRYLEAPLEAARGALGDGSAATPPLVASVHACGALTDRALDLALALRARIAVLPCCQDLATCDTGGLEGWLPGPVAVDVTRAARLRAAGYVVRTQTIPAAITPQARLLLAEPGPGAQTAAAPQA